jgi:hypothetical protein
MNIEKLNYFLQNKYVWPGGYTQFLFMVDGGALCHSCAVREKELLIDNLSNVDDYDKQWRVYGIDVNWEDPQLYCDHCNQPIPPEYPVED